MLSSEEFCAGYSPCATDGADPAAEQFSASCHPLEDLVEDVGCSGEESTGISCSNVCG